MLSTLEAGQYNKIVKKQINLDIAGDPKYFENILFTVPLFKGVEVDSLKLLRAIFCTGRVKLLLRAQVVKIALFFFI